jgi:hypothetical protein
MIKEDELTSAGVNVMLVDGERSVGRYAHASISFWFQAFSGSKRMCQVRPHPNPLPQERE